MLRIYDLPHLHCHTLNSRTGANLIKNLDLKYFGSHDSIKLFTTCFAISACNEIHFHSDKLLASGCLWYSSRETHFVYIAYISRLTIILQMLRTVCNGTEYYVYVTV